MADEQDSASLLGNVAEFADAFFLELGIADGENLVHNEDFRVKMGGDGEGQADGHAAGITLNGGVEELLHFGESDNLVEPAVDIRLFHAEDGAVHVDVFAACEIGVEAGADFEQGPPASVDDGFARGGFGDTAEDFQER